MSISKPGLIQSGGDHSWVMAEYTPDEGLWDRVRVAMPTTPVQRASREDVMDIAATEVALMRLVDRGQRSARVSVRVAGQILGGEVRSWTDDMAIIQSGRDTWAVRVAAIDAIDGLPRALHTEGSRQRTSRSLLDDWTGEDVEVWTRGGRFHGVLVVASDHIELGGKTVIPWTAVVLVHRID